MRRALLGLLPLLMLLCEMNAGYGQTDEELRKKQITTEGGELGKLLTAWWKEGSAAGNVGDWYDNRDGGHSELNLAPYPQLRKVVYLEEDVKARRHWALQPRTLPHVVFGNSSTSAPPHMSGSNVRTYYCSGKGLRILESHYAGNNLYIYPEHRDHDPGHNGVGDGYGDLYPTNTPYLITSQGSSGSDQPFMRAVPFTLAAFRPEVKKKLIDTSLLMPTVQMILRRTNKHLVDPKEYLTGKAHPTVFEGSWVDPVAMAKLAHEIRADTIPPLVKLAVVEETKTGTGRDFFEPAGYTEQHADTASVIARIWRGRDYERRLVVSAEASFDVNMAPLTFTWVVLRGDEKRIHIKPRDKAGAVAEIVVAYHERRPIAPGSSLESNRVDIAVFAHNGVHYSAPAFVTFYSLDCEARTYDNGRPIEIGYGMGESEWKVVDPAKLIASLAADGLSATLFRLSNDQRTALSQCAEDVRPLQAAAEDARKKRQACEAANNTAAARTRTLESQLAMLRTTKPDSDDVRKTERLLGDARQEQKKTGDDLQAASRVVTKANEALEKLLGGNHPRLKASPRIYALNLLQDAARVQALWNIHAKSLRKEYDRSPDPSRRRLDDARRRLLHLGIVAEAAEGKFLLQPARPGADTAVERLTAYKKAMLEHFNAVVLAELAVPGSVQVIFHTNFVDQRLTAPKLWRDVFRYADDRLLGWSRYQDGKVSEFTDDGLLVLKKDAKGRPVKGQTVLYRQDPHDGRSWMNPNPLRQIAGDEVITFEYEGDRRKETSRQKVKEGGS
jgi:hypothetical protein